jgi:hypothetical protein
MSATDTGEHSRSAPWPGAVRAPRRPDAAWRRRARLGLRARWHAELLDREPAGLTAAVAADRHEVLAAAPELPALEHRLRDGGPIGVRGAAMVRLLLSDGTGPLYDPVGAGSVARHARAAAGALRQATP